MKQAKGRQNIRKEWTNGYIEWVEKNTVNISVVFSWQLEQALKRKEELLSKGFNVQIGGPATGMFNLHDPEVVTQYNPNATFTSRGCPRKCKFCLVPKLEGDYQELKLWVPRPTICDNNFLASSKSHFDNVIDSLKLIPRVDFNQGLDARLLTKYHASRLAELDLKCIRLAWDFTGMESQFMDTVELLKSCGIPKSMIRVYVLIGFNDTPDDALYRLQTVKDMRLLPNPMRYQPIDTPKKNSFVLEGWTHEELQRYMRYWANLRITGSIPFEEFRG